MTTKTRYFRKPLALLVLAALGASMLILLASRAQAADLVVTNTDNAGAGSLRNAIEQANASSGVADTIGFDPALSGQTITLASTLDVTDSGGLTIDGGSADITVSGNKLVRVFAVDTGAKLTLSNLTVADGAADDGGGISNNGTLEVSDSTLSGNSAFIGGGIANSAFATLTVTNSTFSGNSAESPFLVTNDSGGGISNSAFATLTVTNSTFSGNSADIGGGIFNDGTLEVSDSNFSGNTALEGDDARGDGGGIANWDLPNTPATVTMTVTNSTFSGNSAEGRGGGIFNHNRFTIPRVDNSTFSGNSARNRGGGVYNTEISRLTVTNSTFSGNSASDRGGGLFNNSPDALPGLGVLTLSNTIVANSPSGGNCDGTITDGGGNLTWPTVESGSCPGPSADPLLGPLADNGGPTQTHALLAGSAAIDAAVNCPPPDSDQRGVSRPQGSACDIGAFELDTTPPSVTINQASGQADPTSTSPIHFTAVFSEPVEGFTDSDVALSGTAEANKAVVSGGPTTFDIAVSGMSADGTVIASIPAKAAQDTALNFNTASTSTDDTVTFIANSAPTAVGDSYSTNEDTPLTANGVGSNPAGVLANDKDPDGDSLNAVLVSGPSHAANSGFTLNQDGSFTYTPTANFNGTDSFTYKATDGTADSNTVTVTIKVTSVNDPPTVSVAAGGSCATNDRSGTINLTVSDPDNPVAGLTLSADSLNKTLVPNANVTFGGSGAARTLTATALSGRTGTAVLKVTVSDGAATGNVDITVVVDGNGSRTITGTQGADMIFGQNGDDTINAGTGNDLACGGLGNDTLNGQDGSDTLSGRLGNDTMTGGLGADSFSGGAGTDTATDYTPSQGDTKDNTIP